MARTSSQISSAAPAPLYLPRSRLDRRWGELSQAISGALGLDRRDLQIEAEYQAEAVWAGLIGRVCERVGRHRGGFSYVAPLAELPLGLWAWLGLQEAWDLRGQRSNAYAFRHLSLTVHFGFPGDPIKPQVFRSEWTGIRNWTGAGLSFQATGAGHPHWQFDLNASLRDVREPGDFADLSAHRAEVEEFEGEPSPTDLFSLLRSTTIERMHFASAAPWWTSQTPIGTPLHMNAPADETSLSRWLVACVSYLKQELARCEILPSR